MKKTMFLVLSLFIMLGLSACKGEEPLTELEAIQKELTQMEGYYCTGTLTRTSNKGEQVYGIKQYAKATGEYLLELTSPEAVAGNYTVFDGSRICQHNPRLGSSLIKDVPESQHRNELFLGQFVENYLQSEGVEVSAAALDEAKCILLEAVIPGTDNALSSQKLWVDRESLLPKCLALYDSDGSERYRIDYEEFVFDPKFEESLFTIEE